MPNRFWRATKICHAASTSNNCQAVIGRVVAIGLKKSLKLKKVCVVIPQLFNGLQNVVSGQVVLFLNNRS